MNHYSHDYYSGFFLKQGEVNAKMFLLLVDISSIRSVKVINALVEYFVYGETRNVACQKYNVNPGYLSIKIKELQLLWRKLIEITPYVTSDFTEVIKQ